MDQIHVYWNIETWISRAFDTAVTLKWKWYEWVNLNNSLTYALWHLQLTPVQIRLLFKLHIVHLLKMALWYKILHQTITYHYWYCNSLLAGYPDAH